MHGICLLSQILIHVIRLLSEVEHGFLGVSLFSLRKLLLTITL